MNLSHRVAIGATLTAAVLGINARIDNDRVYQQAKEAEQQHQYAVPTEEMLPVVTNNRGAAKWFPMAEYAAIGIVSGGALTVEDMYEPGNSYVSRLP